MRTFLLKITTAVLLAMLAHAWAGSLADGRTDVNYLRFTSPRQRSLIIGGSRAARGLHPDAVDSVLGGGYVEGPMYNYAFDIGISPFGPAYLKAIVAKLDPSTRNGLFLIEVDAWMLVGPKNAPNNVDSFPENERALGLQYTFNMRPNYEYLARHRQRGWGALLRTNKVWAEVREDGRLAVIPDGSDGEEVKRHLIAEYRDHRAPSSAYSTLREEYLQRIVALLRKHGRVVLVRLPVAPELGVYENQVAPDLDERMSAVAARNDARYLDLQYLVDSVRFDDGSHLFDTSGAAVSRRIAELIRTGPR
jgi:hypothetical protein